MWTADVLDYLLEILSHFEVQCIDPGAENSCRMVRKAYEQVLRQKQENQVQLGIKALEPRQANLDIGTLSSILNRTSGEQNVTQR